jgi:hypothetical protein
MSKINNQKKTKKSKESIVTSLTTKTKTEKPSVKQKSKSTVIKKSLSIVTIAETPVIESDKTTKKPRKPKGKMYFTSETEDAIIEYNGTDEQSERDDI